MWVFSYCREWGLLFISVLRVLIAVVSLVVELRFWAAQTH